MKDSLLVSVIMITYKHEAFIAEAISGVLMQEVNFPVELIIADDCSPDKTEEVISSFQAHKNYHWIKYTRHQTNKGMMPNFIWALEQCKGKYIALCEGDDYWTDPYKLQKQVDFLESNEKYVLTFHNVVSVDADNKPVDTFNRLPDKFKRDYKGIELMMGQGVLPTLTLCFRNVPETYPEELLDAPLGDIALRSYLGNFGDAKYIADVKPAGYRLQVGGVWTSQSLLNQKLMVKNTYIVLMHYYKNKGDYQMYNYYKNQKIPAQSEIIFNVALSYSTGSIILRYFIQSVWSYIKAHKFGRAIVVTKTLIKHLLSKYL